jgi:hypothetical protein
MNTTACADALARIEKTQARLRKAAPHPLLQTIEALLDDLHSHMKASGRLMPLRSARVRFRHHLKPAFAQHLEDLSRASIAQASVAFWRQGLDLDEVLSDPDLLHHFGAALGHHWRKVPDTNQQRLGASTADTVRELAFLLSGWRRPERVKAGSDRALRGGAQFRRSAVERLHHEEAPYCELCWRLTERDARLERDAGLTPHADLAALSGRFCSWHTPTEGSRYWTDRRRKNRFSELIEAIYQEDDHYRSRFRAPVDDACWERITAADPAMLHARERGRLPAANLYQMRIRLVAYLMTQRLPAQAARAVEIIELQREAKAGGNELLSLAQIGVHLDVSRSEVLRRLSIGGAIDPEPRSALLRWWPFSENLPARCIPLRPALHQSAQRSDWQELASAWVKELYGALPSTSWKGMEAWKLP